MAEQLIVYLKGERVATMSPGGEVRIWEVLSSGAWQMVEGAPPHKPVIIWDKTK